MEVQIHEDRSQVLSREKEHDLEGIETSSESETTLEPSIEKPAALGQLLTLEYLLLLAWFSFSVAPVFYYIGSIGFQLEDRDDDNGFYTNLFSILFSLAAIFSPVGGWLADRFGLGIAEAFGSLLAAFSFFCLSSERLSLNGQIAGLACYGIGRMSSFGMFFCHVGKRFGYHNYGTLAGLGLITSAVCVCV